MLPTIDGNIAVNMALCRSVKHQILSALLLTIVIAIKPAFSQAFTLEQEHRSWVIKGTAVILLSTITAYFSYRAYNDYYNPLLYNWENADPALSDSSKQQMRQCRKWQNALLKKYKSYIEHDADTPNLSKQDISESEMILSLMRKYENLESASTKELLYETINFETEHQ